MASSRTSRLTDCESEESSKRSDIDHQPSGYVNQLLRIAELSNNDEYRRKDTETNTEKDRITLDRI